MKLVNVYTATEAPAVLYRLLSERTPQESISHRRMPTRREHESFIQSIPYPFWSLIEDGQTVGSVYLTRQREIGISILKSCRRRGYGSWAFQEVTRLFPGRILANVNPENEVGVAFLRRMGTSVIQHTYAIGMEKQKPSGACEHGTDPETYCHSCGGFPVAIRFGGGR